MNSQIKWAGIAMFQIVFMVQLWAQQPVFHKDSVAQQPSVNNSIYESRAHPQAAELPVIHIQKMQRRDKMAVSILVISAWGAYFTKKQADYYYKKYSQTGDPTLINRYWDKTRKFDRISDGLIIVSYISTAYIMKRLLF